MPVHCHVGRADFARGPRAPEITFNLHAAGRSINYTWKQAHETITRHSRQCVLDLEFRNHLLELWRARPDGPPPCTDGPAVDLNGALRQLTWEFDPTGAFVDTTGYPHTWTPGLMQHAAPAVGFLGSGQRDRSPKRHPAGL